VIAISKEIEFDAGHRVPDHASKCRNPHGHRYRVRATCEGDLVAEPGAADDGMVVDFGLLKTWLTERVHDVLDHGFIVAEYDTVMVDALAVDPGWRVIVVPFPPTAEHLARWCYDQLAPAVAEHWRGVELTMVELWETPTSKAVFTP